MKTLAEIEAAADSLGAEEQQELFLFLASKLRESGAAAMPREFGINRINQWIEDDKRGMQQLREQS